MRCSLPDPAGLAAFFNRYYQLPVDRAGTLAAVLLLICGTGMILCGIISDRLARDRPETKIVLAICYSVGTALCLTIALLLPPGIAQLAMLGAAMFLVAGTVGPVGAKVANLTRWQSMDRHFATLTLANHHSRACPGPIVTGRIADATGLAEAFRLLPVTCRLAAATYAMMRRSYHANLASADRGNQARTGQHLIEDALSSLVTRSGSPPAPRGPRRGSKTLRTKLGRSLPSGHKAAACPVSAGSAAPPTRSWVE
ncbi:hypothetical protein [Novosphingobium sp.]|uniref:hypothetical protein n=1 Tax=Novosphingobium sp. TaxID=1874826 RepID=UPI0025E98363|nr:hypothetical protein [Novosphingobium sp.]